MRLKIPILFFMFLFNLCLANASDICDQSYITVRVDVKNGQIQCVDKRGDFVVQSSSLDDAKNLKLVDNYELIDTSVNGFTAEQKKTANILNMETKWISGKVYVVDGEKKYPVDIKETLLITKYLAEKKANRKVEPLTTAEEKMLDDSINKIKGAVQELTVQEISKLETHNPQKTKVDTVTEFGKIMESINATATSSSVVLVAMIDGNPNAYVLSNNSPLVYDGSQPKPTITLKTAAGNLRCSGMYQDSGSLPLNILVAKIDFNFAAASFFSYSCGASTCTVIIDTLSNNNVCTYDADVIFNSHFEETDR